MPQNMITQQHAVTCASMPNMPNQKQQDSMYGHCHCASCPCHSDKFFLNESNYQTLHASTIMRSSLRARGQCAAMPKPQQCSCSIGSDYHSRHAHTIMTSIPSEGIRSLTIHAQTKTPLISESTSIPESTPSLCTMPKTSLHHNAHAQEHNMSSRI